MSSNKYTRLEVYRILFGYYARHVMCHLLAVAYWVLHPKFWRMRQNISLACSVLFWILAMSAVLTNRSGWAVLWMAFYWLCYVAIKAHPTESREYILNIWDRLLKWHPGGHDPKAK